MDHTKSDEYTLLRRMLDPAQVADYAQTGGFCVQAASGRRYRIEPGTVSNISELDARGQRCASWCIQTRTPVYITSLQLAQFLLLMTDEEAFRHIGKTTVFFHTPS